MGNQNNLNSIKAGTTVTMTNNVVKSRIEIENTLATIRQIMASDDTNEYKRYQLYKLYEDNKCYFSGTRPHVFQVNTDCNGFLYFVLVGTIGNYEVNTMMYKDNDILVEANDGAEERYPNMKDDMYHRTTSLTDVSEMLDQNGNQQTDDRVQMCEDSDSAYIEWGYDAKNDQVYKAEIHEPTIKINCPKGLSVTSIFSVNVEVRGGKLGCNQNRYIQMEAIPNQDESAARLDLGQFYKDGKLQLNVPAVGTHTLVAKLMGRDESGENYLEEVAQADKIPFTVTKVVEVEALDKVQSINFKNDYYAQNTAYIKKLSNNNHFTMKPCVGTVKVDDKCPKPYYCNGCSDTDCNKYPKPYYNNKTC